MALLRWIHLRKLMPIEELIAGAGTASASDRPRQPPPAAPRVPGASGSGRIPPAPAGSLAAATARAVATVAPPRPVPSGSSQTPQAPVAEHNFKDALLAEIRKSKAVFYNMVVAQAQKIDVAGDRVTFTFTPAQRTLKDQFEQQRAWLESIAQPLAGRKIVFAAATTDGTATGTAAPVADESQAQADKTKADKKSALREQALADPGVQAMLEVFPADIRDIEEM
jgi:hypothetical protein